MPITDFPISSELATRDGARREWHPPLAFPYGEVAQTARALVVAEPTPPKPNYRFNRTEPPTALAHLRDQKVWLTWNFVLKADTGKWAKPPHSATTGGMTKGWTTEPTFLATFDVALATMRRRNLAGIGIALEAAGLVGIDLDACISDNGSFSSLATECICDGETYCEVSPSGEGVHLLATGPACKVITRHDLGVEVYQRGRFFTFTGNKVDNAPDTIAEAPRLLNRLLRLDAETPKPTKTGAAATLNRLTGLKKHPGPSGSDFFADLNTTALQRLDFWVPSLHPTAKKQADGSWRVTSKALGRNLEEDLVFHPDGIRDHGLEYGLTAIDAAISYGVAVDAKQAAMWLCQRIGVEPSSLGWTAAPFHNGKYPSLEDRLGKQSRGAPSHGNSQASDQKERDGKRTQANQLIDLVCTGDVELFHAPDGASFADIIVDGHRETWALKSTSFQGWLRRAYYLKTGGAPNGEAMATAMGVFEARAQFDGVERVTHLRVAEHGGCIYLDLCDKRWRAVEIDENGWRIIDRPPVRFRRTRGMLPLPEPVLGGSVDELRKHLHVDDHAYVLAVSWLLAVLRGRGPYPILALTGEQGTGKSFTAHQLRSLVDPHSAPLRSLPRDTRELYVAAINGYVLVFDNLSAISTEISDALCRLSTGGGFSTRSLYTNDDETIFDGQRPIALTSITDVASRSDLADRLLLVKLEVIADTERRTEVELHAAFDAARPRILGALLDVVAHGLMHLPQTRLNRLPRMADYAVWVRACETAIWGAGMHLAAYETNRTDAVDVVLDADPVAMALRQYMEGRPETTTTATELLAKLGSLVSDHVRRGRQWPGSARALSGQLARLGPALRRVGITVTSSREAGRRLLHIRRDGQ
jgi:hypothetical protein